MRPRDPIIVGRAGCNGDDSAIQEFSVEGWKFVRGFLQHVLPMGFRNVRHYGWMASNSRTTRDRGKWLAWLFLGWTFWLGSLIGSAII